MTGCTRDLWALVGVVMHKIAASHAGLAVDANDLECGCNLGQTFVRRDVREGGATARANLIHVCVAVAVVCVWGHGHKGECWTSVPEGCDQSRRSPAYPPDRTGT